MHAQPHRRSVRLLRQQYDRYVLAYPRFVKGLPMKVHFVHCKNSATYTAVLKRRQVRADNNGSLDADTAVKFRISPGSRPYRLAPLDLDMLSIWIPKGPNAGPIFTPLQLSRTNTRSNVSRCWLASRRMAAGCHCQRLAPHDWDLCRADLRDGES